MIPSPDFPSVIDKAVRFLMDAQDERGCFPTKANEGRSIKESGPDDYSVFFTCLIALAIMQVPHEGIGDLQKRVVSLLQETRVGSGFWRYWPKGITEHPVQRFLPLDLDDSVFASWVLRLNGYPSPDNRTLILSMRNPSGLFYTWILPLKLRSLWSFLRHIPFGEWMNCLRYKPVWEHTEANFDDVDIGVNANVLSWLGEGPHVAPVTRSILELLKSGDIDVCDNWYEAPMVFYHVARTYASGVKSLEECLPLLRKQAKAAFHEAKGDHRTLLAALVVTTLLNTGVSIEDPVVQRGVDTLLARQLEDGSWAASPVFWGGKKRQFCWGSKAGTTGFALEAIARVLNERVHAK